MYRLIVLFGLSLVSLSTPACRPPASPSQVPSAAQPGVVVSRATGGPMRGEAPGKAGLNQRSTLHRESVAVHDPSLPIELLGTPVIDLGTKAAALLAGPDLFTTEPEWNVLVYYVQIYMGANDEVAAMEVRFLTFSATGEIGPTLKYSRVGDMQPGEGLGALAVWTPRSAGEAESFYASIAFVASVRTKDGRLLVGDLEPVLAEARKFSANVRLEDLDSKLTDVLQVDESRCKEMVTLGLGAELPALRADLEARQSDLMKRVFAQKSRAVEMAIDVERKKSSQLEEESRLLGARIDASEKFLADRITRGDFTNLTPATIKAWLGAVDPAQRGSAGIILEKELDDQLRRKTISTVRFLELKRAVLVALAGDAIPAVDKK